VVTRQILPQEFFLKPGYLMAHHEEVMVRCVVGSCVAVTLYDRSNRLGGINHFIWPRIQDKNNATVLYGNIAIPTLHSILLDMGADPDFLEAQIFGGGRPPEAFTEHCECLGSDNVDVARHILNRMNIPIVSEDVGGCKGRKLLYNTATNEVVVLKVDKLRRTDWYDYGQDIDWDRV
jgi:chemotaxis protein CheD